MNKMILNHVHKLQNISKLKEKSESSFFRCKFELSFDLLFYVCSHTQKSVTKNPRTHHQPWCVHLYVLGCSSFPTSPRIYQTVSKFSFPFSNALRINKPSYFYSLSMYMYKVSSSLRYYISSFWYYWLVLSINMLR